MTLEGQTAYVVTATKGSAGPGEVQVRDHGIFLAWSHQPVPVGAQVVITAHRGPQQVSVEPTGL